MGEVSRLKSKATRSEGPSKNLATTVAKPLKLDWNAETHDEGKGRRREAKRLKDDASRDH